jgi:hypothetical protein
LHDTVEWAVSQLPCHPYSGTFVWRHRKMISLRACLIE